MKMGWLGFWLFMTAYLVCDAWLFDRGYDTFWNKHKTEAEKEIQRLKIEKLRRDSTVCWNSDG